MFGALALFTLSLGLKAENKSFDSVAELEAHYVADAMVDMMVDDMNIKDEMSLSIAKDMVGELLSDPMMVQDIQNGDLVLDDAIMADYFLKDTFSSIYGHISELTSVVFKGIKDVTKGAIHLASKTLNAITDSKELMFLLKIGVGIANALIPVGATVLGGALVSTGVGLGLIPVIAAVTPVLMAVVTPGNVETALKVAAASTKLADAYLNPVQEASTAPEADILVATHKKAGKVSTQQLGTGVLMLLKANKALGEYVQAINQSNKWNKLPKASKKHILDALDASNKVIAKVDTNRI